jgi:hypothetical protein
MKLDELRKFYLVGGTALALKYGHRISVDLDLFSNEEFDHSIVASVLVREFSGQLNLESQNSKWGIFCFIDTINPTK